VDSFHTWFSPLNFSNDLCSKRTLWSRKHIEAHCNALLHTATHLYGMRQRSKIAKPLVSYCALHDAASMCIYIYVYICVYIHVYTCVYTFMYIIVQSSLQVVVSSLHNTLYRAARCRKDVTRNGHGNTSRNPEWWSRHHHLQSQHGCRFGCRWLFNFKVSSFRHQAVR